MSKNFDFLSKMLRDNAGKMETIKPHDVVVVYRCPECGDDHDSEDDAIECCVSQATAPAQCPICLDSCESYEDAVSCCLPTYPFTHAQREEILQDLLSGEAWKESIEKRMPES
ncbi:hypothetical protein [Hydrogenophaga sp. NFH-34]|uniref:hypothetical protein n=1 Tax=Hydrogenophaga sp. NFH-34 TaxID=2744446 RepID=UPI001F36B70D|nr:hypothetical protein [Hydrogenophaga sp. NFH-34]